MGQAIGEELVFAVGVALSPIAIIGVILMLATLRARANGPAFVGGWIVGLALAGAIALLAFVLVGTIGAAAPVLLYLVQGERARDRLDRLRGWMLEHNGAVIAVLCIVIGAKLIGDAISGLSA